MDKADVVPERDFAPLGSVHGLNAVFECVLHAVRFELNAARAARNAFLLLADVVEGDELLSSHAASMFGAAAAGY